MIVELKWASCLMDFGGEHGLKVLLPHLDPIFVSVKNRRGVNCYIFMAFSSAIFSSLLPPTMVICDECHVFAIP